MLMRLLNNSELLLSMTCSVFLLCCLDSSFEMVGAEWLSLLLFSMLTSFLHGFVSPVHMAV